MSLYSTALEQLYALAPELVTRPGEPRRKFSLDEVRVLLRALGNPERRYRTVLIAGTNGKGSTAATLESILRQAGQRTGLYTSPHLIRPNERIRINGEEIADERFGALYFRVAEAAQRMVDQSRLKQMPSFFEVLTVMAFVAFADAGVKTAVLEVGMGGRLDATNVADPALSVITDIALDHTEWLGSTLAAIAGEKAGILRPGGRLVCLPQCAEVAAVLQGQAAELRAQVIDASAYLPGESQTDKFEIDVLGERTELATPLQGAHQHRNVALAVAAAVELFTNHRVPGSAQAIAEGVRQTSWPGRLERFSSNGVNWILDVAHNPAGVAALARALQAQSMTQPHGRSRVLVFSCLRDKALQEMAAELFLLFDQVVVAPIASPRAALVEDLQAAAQALGVVAVAAASVGEALKLAAEQAEGHPVVVAGSVYLVGEVRRLLAQGVEQG